MIVKSPEIKHCFKCNECTLLHSHHCDIFETCIAGNNYFHYIAFLFYYMYISIVESYNIIEIILLIINSGRKNTLSKIDKLKESNKLNNSLLYTIYSLNIPSSFFLSFAISVIFTIILLKTIFIINLSIIHIPSFLRGYSIRNSLDLLRKNYDYKTYITSKFSTFTSKIARFVVNGLDKILMKNIFIYDINILLK